MVAILLSRPPSYGCALIILQTCVMCFAIYLVTSWKNDLNYSEKEPNDSLNKAFWGARFSVVYSCTKSFYEAHEKLCTRISNSFSPAKVDFAFTPSAKDQVPGVSGDIMVKCKLSPRSSSAALRQLNLTHKKQPWFFCLYYFINSFANDNEQLETVGNSYQTNQILARIHLMLLPFSLW